MLFSSTTSPWSASVLLFRNSTISARCIFKSQNTFQEHLDYAKVTLVHLKVVDLNAFLSFFWEILHWHFIRTIRYIVHNMQVVYFTFLKCCNSFTSIWWISFDDINIYFLKVGNFIRWSKLFPDNINPIQDGLFRGCSRMGGRGANRSLLHKICHTYPTMMKLGTAIP